MYSFPCLTGSYAERPLQIYLDTHWGQPYKKEFEFHHNCILYCLWHCYLCNLYKFITRVFIYIMPTVVHKITKITQNQKDCPQVYNVINGWMHTEEKLGSKRLMCQMQTETDKNVRKRSWSYWQWKSIPDMLSSKIKKGHSQENSMSQLACDECDEWRNWDEKSREWDAIQKNH